jgi:hypothetical protein
MVTALRLPARPHEALTMPRIVMPSYPDDLPQSQRLGLALLNDVWRRRMMAPYRNL